MPHIISWRPEINMGSARFAEGTVSYKVELLQVSEDLLWDVSLATT